MAKSVEGIYRNGKIELTEPIAEPEGSRVIVTWIRLTSPVNLQDHGIDETSASDPRQRLATFAADWDRPEMDVYDQLPTR